LLTTLGAWLPVIALALFAAGVFLARDRRRALLRGALGVIGALLLFGVGLQLARIAYLDAVPSDVLGEEAAGTVFDTLVRFLRTGVRATAVLGLLVVLGAWLSGPSTSAVRTRDTFRHGIGSARSGAEGAGWSTGPVGPWVLAHSRTLRMAVFVVAGLVLLFWERPTVTVVLVTALLVGVALALVEFLGTPGPTDAAGGPREVPGAAGPGGPGPADDSGGTAPTVELPVGRGSPPPT
jgi:hypothetical protein